MNITQKILQTNGEWQSMHTTDTPNAQLVLVFGDRERISASNLYSDIRAMYTKADIIFCSTAGEILGKSVSEGGVTLSAIEFTKSHAICLQADIQTMSDSYTVAKTVASQLPMQDLRHVLVFSDGLVVNGSEVAKGLNEALPRPIVATGGLVGDGANFTTTCLGLNEIATSGKLILVGLYGSALRIGFGSMGGWDTFGPDRTVTKSSGNVLYELDHSPALDLYKKYLGDKADELPSSALLFPLSIKMNDAAPETVRTILSVNETEKSMTFAGDIPEHSIAKLMKANFDRLVDGALGAAENSVVDLQKNTPEFALLISCIGRRLVLKSRTEEEVEAVQHVVGRQCAMAGFYSYGELCPTQSNADQCSLHNQTMTITVFSEA